MESKILSPRELRRYSKQIMLPGIGLEGQEKLKRASVLIVGAGGLGCPVLQYLTATGVGRIGLIEFDKVYEASLPRQVLYGCLDIGKLKSVVVKDRLEYLNSFIKLAIINLDLNISNSLRIIKDYDLVVDATDNYKTRYLINDTCVILNKPMVHGSIFTSEGQVSVFNYKGGATYRCLYPFGKNKGAKDPSPSDIGIMGVLPGITGTLMTNEVIKIITGVGSVLSGKLLIFNMLENNFRLVSFKNIPENHKITELKEE
jgi:molybdopterin/thiamine biosynthesis adenylyltransferase